MLEEGSYDVYASASGSVGCKAGTAIFYVAEVQAQRTAIGNNRTDWFILVTAVAAICDGSAEPYLAVQLVTRSMLDPLPVVPRRRKCPPRD